MEFYMTCFSSECLQKLKKFLEDNFCTRNVLKDFSFYFISEKIDINHHHDIYINLKQSKAIMIDHCKEQIGDDMFFVISFNKTLIIINQSLIHHLQHLFSTNPNLPFYILSHSNKILENSNITKNHPIEIKYSFDKDIIDNFCRYLYIKRHRDKLITKLWENIRNCIICSLFQESYIKLIEKQNSIIEKFDFSQIKKPKYFENYKSNDFINLKIIGHGSSCFIYLAYHIAKKELFVVKIPKYNEFNDQDEIKKNINNEIDNYENINYPLLSKMYGTISSECEKHLVIQYINGKTLENIKNIFTFDEKINIIFQIIMIINYLHKNNFVYRDLKPNNVIVDENKNVFIFDFDKMINLTKINDNFDSIFYLDHNYVAPENQITFENDIYSIGKMICYIISEKFPDNQSFIQNSNLQEIYKMCTKFVYNSRPSISELMFLFYSNFSSYLKSPIIEKDPDVQLIIKIINQNERLIDFSYQNFPSEYKSDIEKIDNDVIKGIYSKFNFFYFNFDRFSLAELNGNREIIESSLFGFLKNNKFITYQLYENDKRINFKTAKNRFINNYFSLTKLNVIFCVEDQCIVFESLNISFLINLLNKTKSVLFDSMENNSSQFEEVEKFCSYFKHIIKQNRFVNYSIYSIASYLIGRYYQPSIFFNDRSFFAFGENKTNIKSSLFTLFQSIDLQNSEHHEKIIKGEIEKEFKFKEQQKNIKIYEFNENEFIKLRVLNSSNKNVVHLAMHIPTLYLFVIKKFNDNDYKKTFCINYHHHCFTRFYGFVKQEKQIVGLVYEFMSKGTLKDYILNTENHNNIFFSLISMIRIYKGINYIQSLSFIYQNLNPLNFFVDHDNILYFNDFELDNQNTNTNSIYYSSPEQFRSEKIDFQSDIYSIGLIIYFLFEKKDFFKEFKDDISIQNAKENKKLSITITNCSKEIKDFCNKCIKLNPNERAKLNDLRDAILNETKFNSFFRTNFLNEKNHLNLNEIVNYFNENLSFRIQLQQKENTFKYLEKVFIFNSIITIIRKGKNIFELPSFSINNIVYTGDLFYFGQIVERNYSKARKLYKLAQSNSHALFQLGNIYKYNLGIKRNDNKADKYYESSHIKGNYDATLKLGYIFYEKREYKNARYCFIQSSKKYKSESFLMLGKIYFNGCGVEKDYKKAKEYFELSSQKNNSEAFLFLGNIYYYGYDIKKDKNRAISYYEKSGTLNNSESLFILGKLYENGDGVEQDDKKAIQYYESAAKLNNSNALLKLGFAYWIDKKKYQNVEKSIMYFKKFIKIKNDENCKDGSYYRALNEIVIINLIDPHFQIFNNEIFNYMLDAANSDHPIAQNNLGLIYLFYMNNEEKAIHMFEKSSKNHYPLASFNLAEYYAKKENDFISKSIKYYEKAIEDEDYQVKYKGQLVYDDAIKNSIKYIVVIAKLKLALHYIRENNSFTSSPYFIKVLLNINDYYKQFIYILDSNFEFSPKFYLVLILFRSVFIHLLTYEIKDYSHLDAKTELYINTMEKNEIANIIYYSRYMGYWIKSTDDATLKKYIKSLIAKNCDISSTLYPYLDKNNPYLKSDLTNEDILKIIHNEKNSLGFMLVNSLFFDHQMKDEVIKMLTGSIEDFNNVLYKKPYEILFGRLNASPKPEIDSKDADSSFYDGFGF